MHQVKNSLVDKNYVRGIQCTLCFDVCIEIPPIDTGYSIHINVSNNASRRNGDIYINYCFRATIETYVVSYFA